MEIIQGAQNFIYELLVEAGFNNFVAKLINTTVLLAVIASVSILFDLIAKKIILKAIQKFVAKSRTFWDDVLLGKKVFNRVVHIFPALFFLYSLPFVFFHFTPAIPLTQAVVKGYIFVLIAVAIDAFLSSVHDIYNEYEFAKNRPIKGYIQVAKILTYFIVSIIILSVVLNKSVVYFFSGLGALAAVLMLVFKDSILGLVAGIQLTSNNMVKPGDWVSAPKHGADGSVLEISLHTVKIQNWDKTITTIPTYALISESFQNWKGMQESGGRRIKRSIYLDMKSIKFCTYELLEKFKKIEVLKGYVESKLLEIDEHNKNIDRTIPVNGRALTNVGVFRKYLELYLRAHPKVHQELTFLIRQLQPTDKGLPIEIYVFTNDNAWVAYEGIQSDIFDHVLAVIPEFELSVYQSPTGNDFQAAFAHIKQ